MAHGLNGQQSTAPLRLPSDGATVALMPNHSGPTQAQRLIAALQQAGNAGLTRSQVADILYAGCPNGGPLWADGCIAKLVHDMRRRNLAEIDTVTIYRLATKRLASG